MLEIIAGLVWTTIERKLFTLDNGIRVLGFLAGKLATNPQTQAEVQSLVRDVIAGLHSHVQTAPEWKGSQPPQDRNYGQVSGPPAIDLEDVSRKPRQ